MAESSFELKIITPDRVFYEGNATMVEMNTTKEFVSMQRMRIVR